MYIKVAYCCTDENGYQLKTPAPYYGLRIHTDTKRANSCTFLDVPVLRIENVKGHVSELAHPTLALTIDSICVKGEATIFRNQPPPEECRGPLITISQEWIFRVNPCEDEEKEYKKFIAEWKREREAWDAKVKSR